MPDGSAIKADTLFTELELRTQGVESGAAKTKAIFKEIDIAAEKTQRNLDKIGSSNPNNIAFIDERRKQAAAVVALNDAFRAGKITQQEYEQQAIALGVKLKIQSAAGREAAAAFVAEGAAARTAAAGVAAVAVAEEGASVATRGLLASFGPLAVAMIGIELGAKLVRLAWEALTGPGRKAKEVIDNVTDALRKQREEAFKASQQGLETNLIRASFAKGDAERQLAIAQRGRIVQTGSVTRGAPVRIIDEAEVAKAQKFVDEMNANLDQAKKNIEDFTAKADAARASAIGRALESGAKNNALIAEATSLTKKYNAELTALLASGKVDDATVARINQVQDIIEALTAADRKAEKAGETAAAKAQRIREAQESARTAFATATAAFTPGKADDFETQITKLTAQAVKAKLSADEIRKLVADLRAARTESIARDQAALAKDVADLAVRSTVTAVDDLQNSLADLLRTMKEKGANEGLLAQVTALQTAMIEATKHSEELNASLDRIKRDTSEGFNLTGNLADIGAQIDAAIQRRNAAQGVAILARRVGEPQTKNEALAQGDLDKLLEQERILREKIKALHDASITKTKSIAGETAKLAGGIANAANEAFGLATALLGVDSNITKALGSIGQLAGGISNVSGLAAKAGGFGSLFSTGAGIASALPGIGQAIGGGIALASALFGKSPEEKERLARLKENNEALRHLSQRIGDLGKNVTGSQLAAVSQAINNPNLVQTGAFHSNTDKLSRILGQNLSELGLSFEDLAEIAHELGIEIDRNRIQFRDVAAIQEAIRKVELGEFADTFAGQMAKLNAEINVFDITDPIAQFKAFKKALDGIKDGGGVLSDLLETFDLSTAGGVAEAIKALQDLFTNVTSGAVDPETFGGLTGEQLVEAIQKALDLLKAGGGATGTGGFNQVNTITEVTGQRLGALMTTANVFHEQTAKNTALIAQLLNGGPIVAPVTAPVIASSSFAGGGGSYSPTFNINVVLEGPIPDPEETGQRIGRGIIREIDQGLGREASWKRRAAGNPELN